MLELLRPVFDPHDPFIVVSSGNSLAYKTGTQRSECPVFTDKVAPCRQACPVGVDIPRAFHMASKGDWSQALTIYLQEHPLPGVCGRVCYRPCERECHRGRFDESINIRGFERFLSDHGGLDPVQITPFHSKKNRIAVIGSGPAGLSAAYYLARLGYRVTLFEGKSQLGGMLRYGIPSYRLPHSILDRDIERILALGIQVQQGMKVGKEISWKDLKSFDAIFLASGMQSGKMLSIFEDCKGSVVTGLEFLTGPQRSFIAGLRQRTLIIGGGNVAIDVARTLIRLHQGKDTHITLICPESREQMPALPEEISEALEEGVTIIDGWAPHKLHKKSGKISSLDFFKAKVTKDDHSGVLQITRVGKIIQKFKVDSAILAIGQELDASSLPEGIEVRGGKVVTDQFGRTSLPRFFAGGDLIGRNAFVADAIASGKTGALAIASFLEEKDVEKEFENHRIGTSRAISFHHFAEPSYRDSIDLKRVVSFEQMNTLFFLNAARNQQVKINPTVRKETFKEVTRGLKPRSMEEETARCFKCGTCVDCESCIDFCPDISIFKEGTSLDYRLDEDHCKGCGACSVACPRHVIEMVPETI